MYSYTWYQWLTFFYIYCFIGWIIESSYVSFHQKRFVNRGFLRLPLLPLYGNGAIMMLWAALPVKGSAVLVFLFGMAAASLLEYITGYAMERLFKMKYWDYTGKPFNLHGYICLGTSIAWGFLTLFLVYAVHTPMEKFVLSLSAPLNLILTGILSGLFVTDTVASFKQALDLGRMLESMTKMKGELEELQLQISLLKAETVQKVADMKEERMQRAFASLNELSLRLQAVSDKRKSIAEHVNFYRKSLLRGNPSASSRQYAEALKELKEFVKRKK